MTLIRSLLECGSLFWNSFQADYSTKFKQVRNKFLHYLNCKLSPANVVIDDHCKSSDVNDEKYCKMCF